MHPQIKDIYQKFKESSGISTDSSNYPHLYFLTAITRYDLCVSVDARSYHTSQLAGPARFTSQHQQLASQSVSQWLSSHLLERRVSNKNTTSRHGSVHLQFATCCLAPQVNRRCVFSSSAGCYQTVIFAVSGARSVDVFLIMNQWSV